MLLYSKICFRNTGLDIFLLLKERVNKSLTEILLLLLFSLSEMIVLKSQEENKENKSDFLLVRGGGGKWVEGEVGYSYNGKGIK